MCFKRDKKKTLEVAQATGIVVIDNLVATIDNTVYNGSPTLSWAWGLAKGLFAANIQLRQQRAIEFIEGIKDNPGIFTEEILKSVEFQDGFVYTFRKYLNEMKGMKEFQSNDYTVEVLNRLASMGLLVGGVDARYDFSGSTFKASVFGREFIDYVSS